MPVHVASPKFRVTAISILGSQPLTGQTVNCGDNRPGIFIAPATVMFYEGLGKSLGGMK